MDNNNNKGQTRTELETVMVWQSGAGGGRSWCVKF